MSGDGKAKAADNECIQVVARCRPLNRKENEEKRQSIVLIDSALRQVALKVPESSQSGGEDLKSFTFDAAYDENTQQRIFYEESCFSIIECALEGFNSTIFAYGQTGCGKSFTMQGPSNAGDEMKGVIPNSFSHIFQFIKESKDVEFLIRCSYLELYNEEIRDLLCNPKTQTKCELKEDAQKGIFVKNLTDVVVESKEDLEAMLDKGLGNRTVASTLMNAESSRSHSIFTIVIEMTSKDKDTGKEMIRAGKLNLVDLAGSERQKKTGAKDATLKEGIKINLSLSALGNVISALSEGSKHIPYRDSKLTRLLQDSLGGNSKTMMIAAISPADYNYEETLSTLRYANRAKNIKNKPKVNEDPKDTIIREFKEEIERLRKLLAEQSVVQSSLDSAPNHSVPHVSSFSAVAPSTGAPLTPVVERNEMDASISSHSLDWNDSIEAVSSVSPPTVSEKKVKPVESPNGLENMSTIAVSDIVSPQQTQPPHSHEDAMMHAKVKEAHEKLAEKDSQIELERQMREELTQRLQQLQSMLMVSHQTSVQREDSEKKVNAESVRAAEKAAVSPRPTAATSAASSGAVTPSLQPPLSTQTPPELTEEEKKRQQEEDDAQQRYKERRMKAKKQRELKQQQELQRILEEKRLMEEELEELRQSAVSLAAQPTQMQLAGVGTRNSGLQSTSARGESPLPSQRGQASSNQADNALVKKMSKIKKRYEKKLLAAEEELQEIREDFYYQRKQLMDAVIEQEKDTKLYEQICHSILNEKDIKRIIEKSRYDEDAEEWVIPYLKRKSFDSLDSSRGGQLYQYGTAAGSPVIGSTASASVGVSMLPDINLSSYYNKANLGVESGSNSKATSTSSASSAAGAAAAAAASKSMSNNSGKSNAISRVPILTLPGGLTTSASVMGSSNNNNNNSNHGTYSYRAENVAGTSYGVGSAVDDMPGIGFEKEKDKRKLKSSHNKHKVPKPSNNNNNNGSSSSRINDNNAKGAVPLSARNSSPLPVLQPQQQVAYQATGIDEEGSGITAGPVDDWGFAVNNEHSPSTNNTNRNAFLPKGNNSNNSNNNNQQDVEYSDDEDFEADEKTTQQTTPHPPVHGSKAPGSASGGAVSARKVEGAGRKKKKKSNNTSAGQQLVNIHQGDSYHHQEEFNGNVVTTLKQASPRVVSLPPIL